ncbi:hypothetical protein FRZ03_20320 [Streptomyces misionensis]|uniref:Uncharacterized protein n=1 Tax=Streptomyces misionensis TaxID=67331 RepID=A0A5C6JKP6_9ACTN|nr:hypothetical protein FRZ03_20320 [Streptomyces misionensis]
MPERDSALAAPPATVYGALLDRQSLEARPPPDGTRGCRCHRRRTEKGWAGLHPVTGSEADGSAGRRGTPRMRGNAPFPPVRSPRRVLPTAGRADAAYQGPMAHRGIAPGPDTATASGLFDRGRLTVSAVRTAAGNVRAGGEELALPIGRTALVGLQARVLSHASTGRYPSPHSEERDGTWPADGCRCRLPREARGAEAAGVGDRYRLAVDARRYVRMPEWQMN